MRMPVKHKRPLVIAALIMLFAMLVGCGQSVPDKAALSGEGDVVRITLSFSGTSGEGAYYYSIYQLGEAYYFSAGADGVELAGLAVEETDMATARELAAQYGVKSYLEAYKPPRIELSHDENYRTELELRDGTVLAADTAGSWGDALTAFFKGLEAKTASEIPE